MEGRGDEARIAGPEALQKVMGCDLPPMADLLFLTLEVGGRTLLRMVKGGGSYLSASDRRVLFGLGTDAKVGRLERDIARLENA